MMGFGNFNNMMNFGTGFAAFSFLGFLFWLIAFIDLILLGVWLWKQVSKK